jgi:hypothetical protein
MLSKLFKKETPVYHAAQTDEFRADEADVEVLEKETRGIKTFPDCRQMFSLHWIAYLVFSVIILVLSFRLGSIEPTENFLSTRTPIPMCRSSYPHTSEP